MDENENISQVMDLFPEEPFIHWDFIVNNCSQPSSLAQFSSCHGTKGRSQIGFLFWDKGEDPDHRTEVMITFVSEELVLMTFWG